MSRPVQLSPVNPFCDPKVAVEKDEHVWEGEFAGLSGLAPDQSTNLSPVISLNFSLR
jgi:hypothetical protein